MKYLRQITGLGRFFYPSLLWNLPRTEKNIYLTFDDGPVPEVTLWVLELLRSYSAKASFFCIGENIAKHPEVYQQILSEGHSVGNHTYNHLNGWKTKTSIYLDNVLKAQKLMSDFSEAQNSERIAQKLFRPPYGRISPAQARELRKLGYTIVMWEAVSGDFDQSLTSEEIFKNSVKNLGAGSIIVFHDSLKASKNLQIVLPQVMEYYHKNEFSFRAL